MSYSGSDTKCLEKYGGDDSNVVGDLFVDTIYFTQFHIHPYLPSEFEEQLYVAFLRLIELKSLGFTLCELTANMVELSRMPWVNSMGGLLSLGFWLMSGFFA